MLLTTGSTGVFLRGAVLHIQSSHEGLVIREGLVTVRVTACSGFQSLTADVELRDCLVKHVINPDTRRKRSQVLLADVAVLGYHGTAIIRALGKQVARMLRDRKTGTSVELVGNSLSP